MEDAILQLVIKARDEASRVIENTAKSLDKTNKSAVDMGKAVKLAGGMLTAMGIAGVAAMSDWIEKAGEAQAEMAKVDAMIETVAEGNKVAFTNIKKYVNEAGEAYIKLGFDDETTSVAFAKLFQATMDTNEANKLLAISADLARYKNVDLATATTAVMKVTQGSTKELKAMGIAIDDNATAADNLKTVQGLVAGQAQAYAKTWKGAMETMTVQTDNLKEALGDRLLPTAEQVAGVIGNLAEKITALNPATLDMVVKIVAAVTATALLVGGILTAITTIGAAAAVIGATAATLGVAIGIVLALVAVVTLLVLKWDEVKAFFGNLATAVQDFVNNIGTLPERVGAFFTDLFLVRLPFAIGWFIGYATAVIPQIVANIVEWFKALPKRIEDALKTLPDVVANVFEQVKLRGKAKLDEYLEAVKKFVEDVKKLFGSIIEGAGTIIGNVSAGARAGMSQGMRASGGFINTTGSYLMHQGEFVLSNAMLKGMQPIPAEVGNSFNQPITINAVVSGESDYASLGATVAWYLRNSR